MLVRRRRTSRRAPTSATRSWGTVTDEQSDSLLHVVQAIAMSPGDVKKLVRRLREQSERKSRARSEPELEERVADHIVSRYARWASTSGGLTALTGVVPGLGTALAAVGGAATDVAVCMKLQVDMCMCLAETFGHDVLTPDAQHLAFLIAAGGALEKVGVEGGTRVGSKAGVVMLRQYLKGATLVAVRELFKKSASRSRGRRSSVRSRSASASSLARRATMRSRSTSARRRSNGSYSTATRLTMTALSAAIHYP